MTQQLYEYRGTPEHNEEFIRYIRKKEGDKPVVEINWQQQALNFFKDKGIDGKVIKRETDGLVIIIEQGFDASAFKDVLSNKS